MKAFPNPLTLSSALILFGAIVFSACSGSDSGTSGTADTVAATQPAPIYTDVQSDSLSMLLGRLCGAAVAAQRAVIEQQNPGGAPPADNFIAGMEAVFSDTAQTPGFTHGIVASRTIIMILDDFYRQGIVLDKPSLLRGLSQQLMADSLSESSIAEVNARYNRLWHNVRPQ